MWKIRVQEEFEELTEKTQRLADFLNSERTKEAQSKQLDLLEIQLNIMFSYMQVLKTRLDYAEEDYTDDI